MTPLFSGSYCPKDTVFLLKPLQTDMVDVTTKERLIQSGQYHYSALLAPEQLPDPCYLELFETLTARYAQRLASEIVSLAHYIMMTRPYQITVVSLARAGTPMGALLARALRQFGRPDARHYSISILRDRGIDENALAFILRKEKREPAGLIFLDGWTAKGVIAAELRRALRRWNTQQSELLDETLYVIADVGGAADIAVTYDDYPIPSSLLNATVSGLISRSILNNETNTKDFHGCVFYSEFMKKDRSNWFLDQITQQFAYVQPMQIHCDNNRRRRRQEIMQDFLIRIAHQYGIHNNNLIKPGIAEAIRVLLRRLPGLLLLRDLEHPDIEPLQFLAKQKKVPVISDFTMPVLATALIQDVL